MKNRWSRGEKKKNPWQQRLWLVAEREAGTYPKEGNSFFFCYKIDDFSMMDLLQSFEKSSNMDKKIRKKMSEIDFVYLSAT